MKLLNPGPPYNLQKAELGQYIGIKKLILLMEHVGKLN